jgi:hypothetical protein
MVVLVTAIHVSSRLLKDVDGRDSAVGRSGHDERENVSRGDKDGKPRRQKQSSKQKRPPWMAAGVLRRS